MNNQTPLAIDTSKEEMTNSELTNEPTELTKDMVVVSPGTMLREARNKLSLSKEHIASKLNLTPNIVNNIENDKLDPLIPFTFNRGYLTNYARLVGISGDDVLASYQALSVATTQRSEMLSFSKETSKQAEHSRVMWLSYFIVAVLIALTVLWWQQDNQSNREYIDDAMVTASDVQSEDLVDDPLAGELKDNLGNSEQYTDTNLTSSTDEEQATASQNELPAENTMSEPLTDRLATNNVVTNTQTTTNLITAEPAVSEPNIQLLSTAVFTFHGDCWVNIFDATGERIAWGVKKSGYVMTIQGEAPLNITIGKPELTSITFNGQSVDMSTFETGNIAKFNLPIAES